MNSDFARAQPQLFSLPNGVFLGGGARKQEKGLEPLLFDKVSLGAAEPSKIEFQVEKIIN